MAWVTFSAMVDNIIVIFQVFIRQFIWLVMPPRRAPEILLLRKELHVLQRFVKRPQLNLGMRFFCISIPFGSWRRRQHCHNKSQHSASVAPVTCRSQMDFSAEPDTTTSNQRLGSPPCYRNENIQSRLGNSPHCR